jgi:tetratricopeptide (TPR) repeat protein
MGREQTLMRLRIMALLLLSAYSLQAADYDSLEAYYDAASEAIANEHYETAVDIIRRGKEAYPASGELNLLLANLYYDKEIYELALEEYLQAETKTGEDYYTLNQIARCYGKLNREPESITYLQKILAVYPDSLTTIDDLGWMYFKTHQLEKGEALLLGAIARYGPDQGVFMTLGTVYSGLYDYGNAKTFYLKAIEAALAGGDDYFASVAYYNLSLLEHSFYYYNSALRYTEESIRSTDRASGHLSRGELYQSRLDFPAALAEYQQAMAKDSTPLSKVNLGILFQKFGSLEMARRYLEDVLDSRDLSWMYYYGTDRERHNKDIHEVLADVYRGLALESARLPRETPLEALTAFWVSLGRRLKSYYHRQKFRLLSLRVGRKYLEEGNLLDAYWEFYRGNEGYRNVALAYLKRARSFEVQVAPHAEAYYLLEEGRLRGSHELLERSIDMLDNFWEKEGIADALTALVPLVKRDRAARRRALNTLFRLNRGGLLQHGYGLPLRLQVAESGAGREPGARLLARLLRKAGSEVAGPDETEFDYTLRVEFRSPGEAVFTLADSRGESLLRQTADLGGGSRRRRAVRLIRAVCESLYRVD